MKMAKARILFAFLCFCVIFVTCNEIIPKTHKLVPTGWKASKTPYSRPVTLTFAIKQQNIPKLREIFEEVSNPNSQNFRQFLTQSEVYSLISPKDEEISLIFDWLRNADIPLSQITLNPSNDFIIVETTPKKASLLLQCPFITYENQFLKLKTVACMNDVIVPSNVAPLIDFIGGVSFFPKGTKEQNERRNIKSKRVSNNGPIVSKASQGDQQFSLLILPFCYNGEVFYNNSLACSDGPLLTSISLTVVQNTFKQNILLSPTKNNSDFALDCRGCDEFPAALQSYCSQTNEELNLASNTVYCLTGSISLTLKNFIPFNITLQSFYSNLYSSNPSPYDVPQFLGTYVTPRVIKSYYGIPEADSVLSNPQNSQAVAEFLGQFYSTSDLSTFFRINSIYYPGNVILNGVNNQSLPGTEASLDIQFLMGVASNVTTYFWSLGHLHEGQEPFLEWITWLLASPNPPLVNSVSYGDDEYTLTFEYVNRVNNEFMKAGAQGLSILVSSGDTGVNGGDLTPCSKDLFVPAFPASSPYVTTVGGTQFSTQLDEVCGMYSQYGCPLTCNTIGEIASSVATGSRITSGGGFSNYFGRASYQEEVVSQYLNTIGNSIPTSFYNQSGRAYPDISARNFLVVAGGSIHPTDGTSCAAPTAASMMTIINEQLLSTGQKLGFLNPTIYQIGASNFFDITMGDNSCGGTYGECCQFGFSTTPGWDAVTGFGTINFQNFRSAMISPSSKK